MVDIRELWFSAFPVTVDGNQLSLDPDFECPIDGTKVVSNRKITFNPNIEVDYNQLTSFTLPCGDTITFYIAIHKSAGVEDMAILIQNGNGSPIPINWWDVEP